MKSDYVIFTDTAPASREPRDTTKTGTTTVSRDECMLRAAQLVPALQERAAQTETRRRIPEETIAALCEADLVRVLVPARYGGLGLDVDVMLDLAAELGRGCASTAWCYSIWAGAAWFVGMYPEQAQDEFWATGANTRAAGSTNPGGATSVTAVDGLSPVWPVGFCQWVRRCHLDPGPRRGTRRSTHVLTPPR
jgi:alkylation response protein AidB-like acyl-CoA dehydrogenase